MTPDDKKEEALQIEIAAEPELPGIEAIVEQADTGKKCKREKKHWIKNKILREIVSWTLTILIAVLIAVFINAYIFLL